MTLVLSLCLGLLIPGVGRIFHCFLVMSMFLFSIFSPCQCNFPCERCIPLSYNWQKYHDLIVWWYCKLDLMRRSSKPQIAVANRLKWGYLLFFLEWAWPQKDIWLVTCTSWPIVLSPGIRKLGFYSYGSMLEYFSLIVFSYIYNRFVPAASIEPMRSPLSSLFILVTEPPLDYSNVKSCLLGKLVGLHFFFPSLFICFASIKAPPCKQSKQLCCELYGSLLVYKVKV